jgi:hypothetical protein
MPARKKIEEELPLLTSWTQLPPTIELRRERVEVPPWGIAALVQELTGAQQDELKRGNFTRDGSGLRLTLEKQDLRTCVMSMVDGNGNRVFPNMAKGLAHLERLPAAGATIVAEAANRLNKQDDAAKKEMEGNSDSETIDDSTSDSPDISE